MAAHESIHEYYLHQHRNIENYLELCLIHPEVELVHELRLCIKKLRAFHKLAEYLFSNETDEHIQIKRRVRKLYKVAGQLRDTQVQVYLLSLFEDKTSLVFPEYGKWLLRREKKMISRFVKKPQQVLPLAMAQSMHQKIGDLLAFTNDETILTGAGNLLSGMCLESRSLSDGTIDDRKLHRIRTIVKQMRYILSIMNHSYPDFKFEGISIDLLREIEVAAGHWHDNLVRIVLLKRFMKKTKFVDDSDKFKYQKLFNACKAELENSYNETSGVVRRAFDTDNHSTTNSTFIA